MEKVFLKIDPDDPSPAELRGYFADVFAALDERPRKIMLSVDASNDRHARVAIDFEKGEPVFAIEGNGSVRAEFRGRWLAECPMPILLPRFRRTKFVLEPAGGGRIRVRRPRILERIFG